jgi:hypothetical protein
MFKDVFKEVTGIFDRYFLVNLFFPSLVFWVLIMIVGIIGSGWDLLQVIQIWNQQDISFKTLQIILFLFFITLFSSILNSQLGTILRFYEGYWNFPLGFLKSIGKTWHKNKWRKLDFKQKMNDIAQEIKTNSEEQSQVMAALQSSSSQHSVQLQQKKENLENQRARLDKDKLKIQRNIKNDEESIYLYYPPLKESEEQVMPTRLGNILKNAEIYPFSKYKLDAVLIWPRLYNLLPERYIQIIAEAKNSLDFMLIISTLSGIFAILSSSYLLIVKASGWLFLLCFWGGLFIAWYAYRNALSSALLYAQQIKAAFDLYRNKLIEQMRLPLPKTPEEERKLWSEICLFLYSSDLEILSKISWQYKHPDAVNSPNSP